MLVSGLCGLIASAPAGFSGGLPAAQPAAVKSVRSHLALSDSSGNLLYLLTAVTEVSDGGDSNILLVVDKMTDERFAMVRTFDIANHRSVVQIRDIAGKKFVSRSYPLPSAAKTREELQDELRSNPALFEVADPILTIETPSFAYTARASELTGTQSSGRWLSDLRQSLDPSFLEGLERMRSRLFVSKNGLTFYDTLGRYLFHGTCEASEATIEAAPEFPDCNFDKGFGYPCTDKQLERVSKAKDEKRDLTRY
jgi:hypothetical protein